MSDLRKVKEAYNTLMNMQPHIEQSCIGGHQVFIDSYVDKAMSILEEVINCRQEPVAWIPAFVPVEKDGWYWGISSSGAEGKCCYENGEWHHMADRNYCQFYKPLTLAQQARTDLVRMM